MENHLESSPNNILSVTIESELKTAYLDYAMSVIVGRALPDVRDGLKPVHRRTLYAMHELGNSYNKAYKKSARIVGNVVGKYHPHSDTAVYDTLVRMAQPFSLLHVLVDGQGNFGSVDGDAPAAMRYTEVRLTKLASQLLADLEKNTVEFRSNYDESEQEPTVFPASFPNLLLNGSSGIAVGMATNIPPHNLAELIDACVLLVREPTSTVEDLLHIIKGPDFPTAAIINGHTGIEEAYRTGRGKIKLRALAHIEDIERSKQAIVVTELPYQVNKARLIEKIAHMVVDKTLDGITNLRDESDKKGMRIFIEVRRGENAEVLLNKLYKVTDLQVTYGINMVALSEKRPQLFNLKNALNAFVNHKREVVIKRTIFLLDQAKIRLHILEGLTVALDNLDEVIELVRSAQSPAQAKEELIGRVWSVHLLTQLLTTQDILYKQTRLNDAQHWSEKGYQLSEQQAQSILDLRLHRLTGLEQEKICNEFKDLLEQVAEYIHILNDTEKLKQLMSEELEFIKENYAQPRKTEIWSESVNLEAIDLIPKEQRIIILSLDGYIKSQPLDDYRAQKRGGKGRQVGMKSEDEIQAVLNVHSHDIVLCFSSLGKVYWLNCYNIPSASHQAKGQPIINLLNLSSREKIVSILPIKNYDELQVLLLTRLGIIKRIDLSEFSRPRSSGIIAVNIKENDNLIDVCLVKEDAQIMIFSSQGRAIRFHASEIRKTGRTSSGVIGMRLGKNDCTIGFVETSNTSEKSLLCVCQKGYGKRTNLDEFSTIKRGGKGVVAIKTSARNGLLIAAKIADDTQQVLAVSEKGNIIRSNVKQIPKLGRNTQGVRLIKIPKTDQLVSITLIAKDDEQ